MKPEIQRILVASTGHITREDNAKLESGAISTLMSYDAVSYGFLIWVGDDDGILDDHKETLEKDKFAPELHKLMLLARKSDCMFLRLDRDGPAIDGFNTYDW